MANTKISQLTANTNPNGNEELVYAYNNANGKMTTDTLKTFIWSWKQDTLVSGTNIKTINNTSLLGSGNITISWWGGWAWAYDCTVDAWGGGDYSTLSAALTAGETSIFIKNWTYNESDYVTIKTPTFIIQWESSDWVIVNIDKPSASTEDSFIKLDWTWYSSEVIGEINNITLNVTANKASTAFYIIKGTDTLTRNISVNNSYINVYASVSNASIYTSSLTWWWITPNYEIATNIFSINNCLVTSDAASGSTPADVFIRLFIWEQFNRTSQTSCNNSRFYMKQIWHSYMYINWANNDCFFYVEWDESDSTKNVHISIDWTNKWCYFDFAWYGTRSIYWKMNWCTLWSLWNPIVDSTIQTAVHTQLDSWIPYWAKNTSYSVWDVVIYNGELYYCNTAHTSSTAIEYSDWDEYRWFTYISSGSCISWSAISLYWDTIVSNFQSSTPSIWNIEAMWAISGNNITIWWDWYIIIVWRKPFTNNMVNSVIYTRTFNVYALDVCVVNSNLFNFGVAWVVKWVWSNTIISWNVLNAYSWTPTCSVANWQNNIADNNIISAEKFNE